MKSIIKLSIFSVLLLSTLNLVAQTDERNKIQMVVSYDGKTITTDLTNVGMGITRYKDYTEPAAATGNPAATKEKSILQGAYYLTISVKKVSNDLLKLFSKKQTVFSGTITITDSYGKNPPREIKFTNASLESYSDQFSTQSYEDSYSSAAISLSAKGLTVNGVVLE